MENNIVDQTSMIKNCYFYGGVLDGEMIGGVWRSGKVGEFGTLSDTTKIATDMDSYFNTKIDNEEEPLNKDNFKSKKINPFQPRKF